MINDFPHDDNPFDELPETLRVPVPIFELHRGDKRQVGYVQDGVWCKNVSKKSGYLRNFKSWAVSIASLEKARNLGAHTIQLTAVDEGNSTYTVSTETMVDKGTTFDFGHGKQIRLHIDHWASGNPKRQPQRKPEKIQSSLFDCISG